MANLNDLPLNNEEIPDIDPETVPMFGGAGNPIPQPGLYTFRLPSAEVLFNCFELEETDEGQRLRAVLREEAALWNETLGAFYDARISTRTRYVPVKSRETGESERVAVSDFAQLLRAVHSKPENTSNPAFGAALVAAAGRSFKGVHDLTARCDRKRDIYKDGAVLKGKKGCGQVYATEPYTTAKGDQALAIPRDEQGKFALRFECKCGAEIRCWGQLRGFRVVRETPHAQDGD